MRRLAVLAAACAAALLALFAALEGSAGGSLAEREARPPAPGDRVATPRARPVETSGARPERAGRPADTGGSRASAAVAAIDLPPAGKGRLRIDVRYVDGGAVGDVVPVGANGDPIRHVVRIGPGEVGALDLAPGAYVVAVTHPGTDEDAVAWQHAGDLSRTSVDVVEGEVATASVAVVRAGALVATITGDADAGRIAVHLLPADGSFRSTTRMRGTAEGREIRWARLRPGEYQLRGSALSHPMPVTILPGETQRVTVHPAIARLVTRVRVMASDGSGPYPVPAVVSVQWRREDLRVVQGRRVPSPVRSAVVRRGEDVEMHLPFATWAVTAAPLDGHSFATRLTGRCEEIVELNAPGQRAEVDLDLVLDAPAGIAVVEVDVEGREDVWLHAADGSQPPVQLAERGIGVAVALDVEGYGAGSVELTDAAEPGEGRLLRTETLEPGTHAWTVVAPD